ncbi:NAD-binding protein [Thermosynechococcaceae cyanobacterium Okahandja]
MASLPQIIDQQLRQLLGGQATWFIDAGDRHLGLWIEGENLDLAAIQAWGDHCWQRWLGAGSTVLLIGVASPGQPFPYWHHRWAASSVTPTAAASNPSPNSVAPDRFIVCGLGSLGQFCLQSLLQFGGDRLPIEVCAIERYATIEWDIPHLRQQLQNTLYIGDCRQEETLRAAGIDQCRALLAVTSDEATNIATAIVARRLNPNVHLVVRSGRDNLNALLQQKLGSFVALNPTELPAPAFALAALEEDILAAFTIEGEQFRVLQHRISTPTDPLYGYPTYRFYKRQQRLISIRSEGAPASLLQPSRPHRIFYHWSPDRLLQLGDRPIWIERVESLKPSAPPAQSAEQQWLERLRRLPTHLRQAWQWIQGDRSRQLIFSGLCIGSGLWLLTTLLLRYNVPGISWQKAFTAGFILLLGGFSDVFGGLEEDPVPPWLLLICILIAIVSLLFILGVLGLLAEKLLQARFDFLRRRPPLPTANHVIVVGRSKMGEAVVRLLQSFQQPLLLLVEQPEEATAVPQVPAVWGSLTDSLAKSHLDTAKSMVVTTADEMLNLEIALIARQATETRPSPLGLVVGIYDPILSSDLKDLLPHAQPLCAYALAAEAFAGAAFGETMLGLFQIEQQTILIADYTVTATDTLVGKLIGDVAYGYGVVPVFYNRHEQLLGSEGTQQYLPSDTLQLTVGDRLVILATIHGLRRIEQGSLAPRRSWRLWLDAPRNTDVALDIGNLITKITGLPLPQSRAFIEQLPAALTLELYEQQVYRLAQQLQQLVRVRLYPLGQQ